MVFDTNFTQPETGADPSSEDFSPKKSELVGAVLVATTKAFDPEMVTQYGVSPAWTGDILLVDGPFAGRVFTDVRYFGLLAEQLEKIPENATGVAVIVSGKTRQGRDWIGANFEVDAEQLKAAKKAVDEAQDKPAF